jgi:hypothetical protein
MDKESASPLDLAALHTLQPPVLPTSRPRRRLMEGSLLLSCFYHISKRLQHHSLPYLSPYLPGEGPG